MKVSAYIIFRNAGDTLEAAIASIRGQDYPVETILLVDDGSSAASYTPSDGIEIIRLDAPRGRGFARRAAVERLDSELIFSLDAAQQVQPDFVRRAVESFADNKVAAVFGQVRLPSPRTAAQRWCARHVFRQYDTAELTRIHHASLRTGGAVLRRSAVMEVGNFNPSLSELEDRELGARLTAADYDVIFDPGLLIDSIGEISLQSAFEKYMRWNQDYSAPYTVRQYLKEIAYAGKILAPADLAAGDIPSAFISLSLPHVQIMRAIAAKNLS